MIALVFVAGLPLAEAAAVLGVPVGRERPAPDARSADPNLECGCLALAQDASGS